MTIKDLQTLLDFHYWALHRAFEQRLQTLSLPIMVRFNGAPHRVHIQVRPSLQDGETEIRSALVLFIEGGQVEDRLVRPVGRR